MKRYLPIAVWAVALSVIAGALLFLESDFLWKVQEGNLFLETSLFFREQMVVPGGLLSWIGTFLTQFFYVPWLGTLLLCLLWLLLMWLVKRAFLLSAEWSALSLVPVGLLLLTIVDMGYWLYMLKLQGHVFVGTLGTVAVAALLWAFRVLPDRYWLRPLSIVMTAVVGYPLLGIYGLAATLLMGIWSWRLENGTLWKKMGYSPFFAHIDKDGKWGKPFELPQQDPDYPRQLLRSYNIPEFMRGPVTIDPHTFADVLKGEGEPVKYVQQLSNRQ